MGTAWAFTSDSPVQTHRLGQVIGRALQGGDTLALYGPLGAGKTALVKGIAAGLGAAGSSVSSPTFVLIHEYKGRLPLAHVDLYRLGSAQDLESTGLVDYLRGSTVTAIEWAEKGRGILPGDRLEIELRHRTVGSRTIRLTAAGPRSATLLERVAAQMGRAGASITARTPKRKPKGNRSR